MQRSPSSWSTASSPTSPKEHAVRRRGHRSAAPGAGLRGPALPCGAAGAGGRQGRADGRGLAGGRGHRRQPGAGDRRHPPRARRRGPRGHPDGAAARLPAGAARSAFGPPPVASRRRAGGSAAAALLLAAAGAFAGWFALRPEPATAPAAAAIAGPPIVAVVPFVDLAGDAASRRLGEAFHEYCTHDLSWFREFQMVLRSPTFVYRDQAERGLPVDYVLGGTVDRQGDRLRLTAELTNGRTGEVVWSERWDRPERDVEAMREEIAQAIGGRLGGATGLIQEAGRAAARAKPPHERTPWDLLLLGSGQLALGTRAGAAQAAALLGEAVSLDPGLAHAEALRALAHLRLAEFGQRPGGQPAHRPRRRGGGGLSRRRRRVGLRRPRRGPATRGGSGACTRRVRHGAEPHPERRWRS